MLTCVIIDDEQHCIDGLTAMLTNRFAGEIKILAVNTDSIAAHQIITQLKPDIVFLDVEMPRLNGIDLLKMFVERQFEVVFTTAYEKYAVEAIKSAAADYLVKPFSIEDLNDAIIRCNERLEINKKILKKNEQFNNIEYKRFAITAHNGTLLIVNPADIIWIKAESNYSTLYFTDKPKLLVPKTLKEFDEQLTPYQFFRSHSSSLVNLQHVVLIQSADGIDYLQMKNGDKVELARRRKADFFETIKKI
jgi:two-component system, LytTR family, response regulator